MKKIISIFLLCALVLSLAGCGQSFRGTPDEVAPLIRVQPLEGAPLEPDTKGLKHYELESGVSFYAIKGLDETQVDGMAAYLRSGYFLVMVIEEPKSGTALEGVTLEAYGEMLAEANGLEPFVADSYGTLATTNIAGGDDTEELFFYYVTIHETPESIWLVQVACPDDLAENSAQDLAKWSATFSFGSAE